MLWLVRYKYKYQKRFTGTKVHKDVLYNDIMYTKKLLLSQPKVFTLPVICVSNTNTSFTSKFCHQQHRLQHQQVNNDSFNCDDSSFQFQYIEESEFELHSTPDNHGESENNSSIACSNNCTNTDDTDNIVIAAIAKRLKVTNWHNAIMPFAMSVES